MTVITVRTIGSIIGRIVLGSKSGTVGVVAKVAIGQSEGVSTPYLAASLAGAQPHQQENDMSGRYGRSTTSRR